MQFTDDGIGNITVERHYTGNSCEKAVFFDIYNEDTGSRTTGFFTEEELQELIKLIEETN